MGRDVDDRKKRAALRKLRKAAALAEQGLGPPLSDWEQQFLEEVEQRIETYGSAFADPMKGDEGEALSALQQVKLKEIDKKARGKGRKGFKPKTGFNKAGPPRVRQVDDDIDEPVEMPAPPSKPAMPKLVKASDLLPEVAPEKKPSARPVFRVIEGGKQEE